MAAGKSNAQIGRDLYLSEDTIKTHARRLFRKLERRRPGTGRRLRLPVRPGLLAPARPASSGVRSSFQPAPEGAKR